MKMKPLQSNTATISISAFGLAVVPAQYVFQACPRECTGGGGGGALEDSLAPKANPPYI